MRVSRAVFLKTCTTVLLGARLDAGALLKSGVQPRTTGSPESDEGSPLRNDNASRFRQQLNTFFTVHEAGGASVAMMLARVSERPITKNVEQFSLIFHAPADAGISDGTHRVQHDVLGDFDLFIVPVGAPNRDRTVYQACFSRHLSRGEVDRARAAAASPHRRT